MIDRTHESVFVHVCMVGLEAVKLEPRNDIRITYFSARRDIFQHDIDLRVATAQRPSRQAH